MSAKGLMVYLIVRVGDGDQHDAVKLLEFRTNDDSGHLAGIAVIDVPVMCLEGEPFIHCTSAPDTPFICINAVAWHRLDHLVAFDMRSQMFYKYPPLKSGLTEMQPLLASSPVVTPLLEILLTTTQIIVMTQFFIGHDDLEDGYLIQAFVVPDSPPVQDNRGVCELQLSHQNGGLGHWKPVFYLIRNSVTNGVDGSTTFSFMHVDRPQQHFEVYSTEFTLPQSRTDAVLPIFIDTEELFRVERFKGGHWYNRDESDGIVRGIFAFTGPNPSGWDPVLYKFSIDATGEECTAAYSSPVSGFGLDGFHPRLSVSWFDSVRGRICYAKNCDDGDADSRYYLFVVELD